MTNSISLSTTAGQSRWTAASRRWWPTTWPHSSAASGSPCSRGAVELRALDYQVVVVVLRFDGSPGRQVTLDARWRLLGKNGQELALKRSSIVELIGGDSYQALVRGMNGALAQLGREIATQIRSRADTRARAE